MIILASIFIILGLLIIIFPKMAWKIKYGWQFKNAKPSKISLIIIRISGLILIIIGAAIFYASVFSLTK